MASVRSGRRGSRRRLALVLVSAVAVAGCDHVVTLPSGSHMELDLTAGSDTSSATLRLGNLDPARDGVLVVWIAGNDGVEHAVANFTKTPQFPGDVVRVPFELPVAAPADILVTLQPPGDTGTGQPSEYHLLEGHFNGQGTARLSILGAVTDGRALERHPGAHSLFTSSNNVREGYPSEENSGLWYFTLTPWDNPDGSRYVKLTPLQKSWVYEGWIVFKQGTSQECWISHGKFRPDLYGLLTSRDNTGSGPFSGDVDYVNGGIEDVPGDEWTTNIFNLKVPCGLTLPFALDSVDAAGKPLWSHVITIEPAFQESEPLLSERPFILRPYWNEVGAGGPGVPRMILFQDDVLQGVARRTQ